jgi:hypothetical protein
VLRRGVSINELWMHVLIFVVEKYCPELLAMIDELWKPFRHPWRIYDRAAAGRA